MAKQKGNKGKASRKMARLVIAEKKESGSYGYRQKMVPLDNVQEELKAAKN